MTTRSIGQQLVERLDPLRSPTAQVDGTWGRVAVSTRDVDRLGVMVEEIVIDRLPGSMSPDVLRRRLEDLAARVDYLPEWLTVVEHDPARTGALMRSAPPRRVENHRQYFELRVSRIRSARFCRFDQPPEADPRAAVPFLLDRRTVASLVDDLIAALSA